MSPRRHGRTTAILGSLAAAALVSTTMASTPSQAAPGAQPQTDTPARIFWADGKPLTGKSAQAPGQVVKSFMRGKGASAATADSLRPVGPAWKARGVEQLRLEQYVAGLRVHNAYAKAALDKQGRLISLIDATAKASKPAAASASEDDALRAAMAELYPGRSATTAGATKSGNVTAYPRQGFSAEPTVERVAVPTTDGKMGEAFEVTTWDDENDLHVTLVSGDGNVVATELRTANEAGSYNVFPTDPDTDGTQQLLPGLDTDWLGTGPQTTREISGNNAHAYLDAVEDNQPDGGGTPVTDGVFDAVFNPTTSPSAGENPDVAVQNLFYLNNVIHDVLYTAGFTEAAGNFQADNYGLGGRGKDPVQAEAQDGGGTDNANFATPRDGQAPRMQMYLWNAPFTHEVVTPNGNLDAAGAAWGTQLNSTGISGSVVRADDGTGTASDACESLPAVAAGSIVVADRGTCNFTIKAKNAQLAGASAIIIANNDPTAPFNMGGEDASVTIPGVMVSQADGATLSNGMAVTVRAKSPAPIMRDGDLDSDIVWHEYGHGLTWRMIGRMDGPLAGAIGEGMSDVLAIITNDDPVVGEYSMRDPLGIRSARYDAYPRTYGDITGTGVHFDGEVYGAIGWALWEGYQGAGLGEAAILADLVDGMNYTPAKPTYEQMRDGILASVATTNPDRACMVWDAFAQYGVGVGAKGTVRGSKVLITESFDTPAECN